MRKRTRMIIGGAAFLAAALAFVYFQHPLLFVLVCLVAIAARIWVGGSDR